MSLGRRASHRFSNALIEEYKITPDERTALIKKYEETQDRFTVKIRTDPVYRLKFFQTFWIWYSFLVFGWIYGQIGPTLPDLQLLLDIDLQTASWLFTSFSFGYMIGCLLHGALDGKGNTTVILALYQFGAAIFTTAVPWCTSLWLMILMRICMGICIGGLDTGSHAELFSIWRTHTAAYVQIMYFNFGLGGLVTPIATKYFMAPEDDHTNKMVVFGSSTGIPLNLISFTSNLSTMTEPMVALDTTVNEAFRMSLVSNFTNATVISQYAEPRTRIQWAFLISGVLAFTAGAGYIASYRSSKRRAGEEDTTVCPELSPRKSPSKPVFILVMVVLTLLLLLVTGWIDTFAGFLTTFCIRELGWSKDSGVLATTVFWVAFCVVNFFTIFLLQCFSTESLLFGYLALSLVSFICLLLSSVYKVEALVWASIALTGSSMSIMWPAMFAWTEETVTEVSRKVSSLFLIAGGVGLMVNPLILGYLMDHVAPIWFVYFLSAEGLTIFIAFTIIAIIYRQLAPPVSTQSEDVTINENSNEFPKITDTCLKDEQEEETRHIQGISSSD